METSALFRNYNLIFKPADFGFVVLYTPESSEEKLKAMPPNTKFSFIIRNKNLRFMNFSKIPFRSEGLSFHYSNLYNGSESLKIDFTGEVYYYFKGLKIGEVKKKLLHLPDHILLSNRPSKFNYMLGADRQNEKGASYDSIVIKDESGAETLENGVPLKKRFKDVHKDLMRRHVDFHSRNLSKEGLTPSQKEKRMIEIVEQQEKELAGAAMTDHFIDLRHVPSGKYTLKFGEYPPSSLYVTEHHDHNSFGMMDIYLDSPADALINRKATKPEEVINPQLFHIHYEARATYWRYVFVNYEGSKVIPKHVRDENSVISFTEPVESRLDQVGTVMQYCQSETPVLLQDRPNQVFFLARMNGKRNMKEIRLPTPAADMVKPERQPGKEEKIISEVYVYI
jgi:hypothetical protein